MHPFLSTALGAAEAAAAVQRRHAGRLGVAGATEKGSHDYVSQADLEAQEAALAVIHRERPGHRVLAEEDDRGDGTGDTEGAVWVVDPIDGTTNFLHGHPMHAVSVALVVDGVHEVGVVACPATGERWWAVRGEGAWKNGRPVAVSKDTETRHALVGTGFPFKLLERTGEYMAQLGRVLAGTSGVRRGGAAALDLAYLAQGSLDAFWELELQPWDFAAGVLLVREAGGVVERIEGGATGLVASSVIAANGPALLDALRSLLDGDPGS